MRQTASRLVLCFVFFLIPVLAICQTATSIGDVTGVREIAGGYEFTAGKAKVRVTAEGNSSVRVRVAPEGEFSRQPSWAVTGTPSGAPARLKHGADFDEIAMAGGAVRVMKKPLRLVFLDDAGKIVSEDDPRAPMMFLNGGFRVTKKMPEDEMYSGLGDKTSLNLRNQAFTLWNTDAFGWQESTDPLYKAIPFFMALRHGRAYGIFLDNTWRTWFDFGKTSRDSYSFGSDGGELDYHFFFGPGPRAVLMDYAKLTGTPPLPPMWALGYQQCRYSYYPEARVREVARLFREKKIPADVIYLDIDYQQSNRPFTVDRERFPHFEQMIADLRREEFHVVTITDPHLAKLAGYRPFDEGSARDLFVKNADGSLYVGRVWPGDSVFPDFTLTAARLWWGTLYEDFLKMGVSGFWNDMDEPAIFERLDKTMPLTTRHRLDDGTSLDHRAAHNIYGMQNSRATYEGLLKLQGNERPFVLTRATYAGGQRYAASWTGDNSSTWNHMRMTLPTLLNLGISGFGLVGVDIGGFNGSPTPELLTRWMGLGAFNPVYRNHGNKGTADREPWVNGPEHEQWRRQFIEQRYRMMPYVYTLAEEMSRTGVPMMRPLFLEFPREEWLKANQEEFMFGPAMLVAPQVWEFTGHFRVLLPQGDWYDYRTGKLLHGGEKDADPVDVEPRADELPVYVRAGSIIPHQPLVQSTQETPQGPLELRVYPGADCGGSLYLDDGHTFNYKKGEYLRQSFSCSAGKNALAIRAGAVQGTFMPWFSRIQFTVYGVASAPSAVTVNGVAVKDFQYDAAGKVLTVSAGYERTGMAVEARY